MKTPAHKNGRMLPVYIVSLIAAACGVRLFLADTYAGFVTDQSLFVQWMETIRRVGLGEAFLQNGSMNYPPLFLVIMDGYGAILSWFGMTAQVGGLSFKGVLLLIDLAVMLAAIKLTAGMTNVGWRMFVLALFALNPVLIADSAVWGQVDLLHSMLMVLAVSSLAKRPWLSGIWTALALLTKFQAITIMPVIGMYLLVEIVRHRRWHGTAGWLAGFSAPWAVAVAYFASTGSLAAMIRQAYTDAVGMYASASINAANIWFHLVGVDPSASDTEPYAAGLSLRTVSLLLFAAAVVFVCVYMWVALKARETEAVLFKAAAVIGFAFFMLPTEIHERYGIPALVFALFAVLHDRKWTAAAVTMTVTTLLNVLAVLRDGGGRAFGGGGRGLRGFRPGANGSGEGLQRSGGSSWGEGMPDAGFPDRGSGSDLGGGNGFPGNRGMGGRGEGADGGAGGFPFGGGVGTTLSHGYVWVAAVNALLLIWLLWALWREMAAVRRVRLEGDE